jgi:hypothetical protein
VIRLLMLLMLVVATPAFAQPPGDAKPTRDRAPEAAPRKAPRSESPRRLGAVDIEGEIAAPKVLFIAGRDRRRHRDGLHRRYLATYRELIRETPLPVRLRVRIDN